MADKLTTATAIKYVQDYFASIGSTAPEITHTREYRLAPDERLIDVAFTLDGGRYIFTCWLDQGLVLYGEW